MLFNSYIFIFVFLPITFLLYFLGNHFGKYTLSKVILIVASLTFYACYNVRYLPIIVISIVANYFISTFIIKQNGALKKILLYIGLIANIGALVYFKHFDFFIGNINQIFNTSFSLKHLVLPLGISFFTFQQISYIVDSYKSETKNYSFVDYALFISFFPQLVAGPIVLHSEIIPQFQDEEKKKINLENVSKGIVAFAFGLFKKVLIADTFGAIANVGFADVCGLNSVTSVMLVLSYTFEIYFDFSGYCDMATGIGLLFNINIPMNFNSPYKATSVNDFWKRWHITLTRFFRQYVYFPLGGNRKGKVRTYVNVMIVYLLSGFWHGANWTFIVWGMLHGFASVVERMFWNQYKKINAVIRWILTFGFVNFAWVFFRADSVGDAFTLIKNIFRFDIGKIPRQFSDIVRLPELEFIFNVFHLRGLFVKKYPGIILVAFFAIALLVVLRGKNTNERIEKFKPMLIMGISTALILVWSIISLSGVTTFLYWDF